MTPRPSFPAKVVTARLRALPSVDRVLRLLVGQPGAADIARAEIDALRAEVLAGAGPEPIPDVEALAQRVRQRLAQETPAACPAVVNATGVLLHTGLGRAPLSASAGVALARAASGFTLLEVDPATGDRRHREDRLLPDLLALTGAASGTVVNNNAGALLLALTALAGGRQVLVSRGQLIEIGGGFRLPDLMRLSGAQLVEVGTTNRTYARDFAAAIGPQTALLLVVHTSNFRVVGFQHSPAREELVALARSRGVPVLEDIGSGLLSPAGPGPLQVEPDARSCLAAGVDLVCFSGDKLLGGPQAGILAGREDLVAACRRHDLFRALRPDRLCLAALAATLSDWRRQPATLPVVAALAMAPRERLERARALAARLAARFPRARFEAVLTRAQAGSGSLPGRDLRSAAVEVQWPGTAAEALAARLRTGATSIFPRVWRGRVRLDVLALLPGDGQLIEAALDALGAGGPASAPAPGLAAGRGAARRAAADESAARAPRARGQRAKLAQRARRARRAGQDERVPRGRTPSP